MRTSITKIFDAVRLNSPRVGETPALVSAAQARLLDGPLGILSRRKQQKAAPRPRIELGGLPDELLVKVLDLAGVGALHNFTQVSKGTRAFVVETPKLNNELTAALEAAGTARTVGGQLWARPELKNLLPGETRSVAPFLSAETFDSLCKQNIARLTVQWQYVADSGARQAGCLLGSGRMKAVLAGEMARALRKDAYVDPGSDPARVRSSYMATALKHVDSPNASSYRPLLDELGKPVGPIWRGHRGRLGVLVPIGIDRDAWLASMPPSVRDEITPHLIL